MYSPIILLWCLLIVCYYLLVSAGECQNRPAYAVDAFSAKTAESFPFTITQSGSVDKG